MMDGVVLPLYALFSIVQDAEAFVKKVSNAIPPLVARWNDENKGQPRSSYAEKKTRQVCSDETVKTQ